MTSSSDRLAGIAARQHTAEILAQASIGTLPPSSDVQCYAEDVAFLLARIAEVERERHEQEEVIQALREAAYEARDVLYCELDSEYTGSRGPLEAGEHLRAAAAKLDAALYPDPALDAASSAKGEETNDGSHA